MAEMLGDLPRHLVLIGVQPVELDDFGGSLRKQVRARIEPAIQFALDELAAIDIHPTARPLRLIEDATIASNELVLQRYESERPDSDVAPRHGDPRFLDPQRWHGPGDFEAEIDRLLGQRLDAD